MLLERRTVLRYLSAAICIVVLLSPVLVKADQRCDIRDMSDRTKAISTLSAFQDGLNFLAVSQSIAIIEIETGTPIWPLHVEKKSFFGPLGGLRKFTDKTETYLNNLDKNIRRLSTFDRFGERYEDIAQAKDTLVAAGYEILSLLDGDNADEARHVLSSTTLPTLERVRGDIYSTVSELERSVTLDAIRCR